MGWEALLYWTFAVFACYCVLFSSFWIRTPISASFPPSAPVDHGDCFQPRPLQGGARDQAWPIRAPESPSLSNCGWFRDKHDTEVGPKNLNLKAFVVPTPLPLGSLKE